VSRIRTQPRSADFVLDGGGLPTSHAAYRLVSWLFDHRDQAAHISEISETLRLPQSTVRTMCRQLELLGLVVEEPRASYKYRYHLRCHDFELQAKVESAIVDYHARGRVGLPDLPSQRD